MDLATNALDACSAKSYKDPETAEIVFSVYSEKNEEVIVVDVGDNGIGMDEETKINIFAPFFSTKDESGTGLGLALTAGIVKLHGGEIGVESEPEKGSRFRIALPISGADTSQGGKDEQESRRHR
jgi:signal transduction histidine kinase